MPGSEDLLGLRALSEPARQFLYMHWRRDPSRKHFCNTRIRALRELEERELVRPIPDSYRVLTQQNPLMIYFLTAEGGRALAQLRREREGA